MMNVYKFLQANSVRTSIALGVVQALKSSIKRTQRKLILQQKRDLLEDIGMAERHLVRTRERLKEIMRSNHGD